MKLRVLLFAVLAAAASSAAQKEEHPSFPAGTEIVTVDAVVLDKQGAPIRGLTQEDFSVSEDGVPQEITAFEAADRPVEPVSAPAAATVTPFRRATSSNVDAESRTARGFVLVFDELHLTPSEAKSARDAVKQFLGTGVAEGDCVTLIGTAGTTWWTARIPEGRDALLQVAARLQGRRVQDLARDDITDYEAMRIDRDRDPIVTDRVARRLIGQGAIFHVNPAPGDPNKGDVDIESERDQARARAAEVYASTSGQNATTLADVERALASLTTVRGRKSLILLSGGLVADTHLSGFRRVVAESRRANVAIYFLDARGLTSAPTGLRAETGSVSEFNDLGSMLTEAHERTDGAVSLAADTGGFAIENQNNLGDGISRIARESASYYLLGYSPSNKRADGRFRKIEVKVRGSGRGVRARRGYYAPGGEAATGQKAPEPRDAAIQRAIDSPFDLPDVPLRATVHVLGSGEAGKAQVLVTVEADIRPLAFSDEGGTSKDTLEMMMVVADRGTGEFFRFDQQFNMSFRPETRTRYAQTWLPISREVPLGAGSFQARIVARDKNSGRVGTVTHDFDVPTISGFRVSTPVLSDRLQETGAAGARNPEVTARRVFAPMGLLHCRFELYGAAKDAATGAPRVTAGFSIRRSDGKFLAAAPETPLKPAADGTVSRTMGTALEGAPVGLYEMIVVATDLVAGQAAEIREPFEIASTAD